MKAKDCKVVKDPEIHVPTFEFLQKETKLALNPLIEWIGQEIRVSEKETPLGGYVKGNKLENAMKDTLSLYPTCLNWCKRNGVNPYKTKRFVTAFENTCKGLKISVEKVRRDYGTVFRGVAIDPKVGDIKHQIGDARDQT